jgi:hypothetical protein
MELWDYICYDDVYVLKDMTAVYDGVNGWLPRQIRPNVLLWETVIPAELTILWLYFSNCLQVELKVVTSKVIVPPR